MQRKTNWLLELVTGVVLAGIAPIHAEDERPNIVLVFMDDMGWKDTGFMGSRYYETPNMDRLAAQGLVFTDAYVTAPSCTPSRAGLMAGQYTARTGVYKVNPSPVPSANPEDCSVLLNGKASGRGRR